MSHHADHIPSWIFSDRLYENSLFFYMLIIVFWFFVGFIFMGFEIDGFSQQMNLLFNFIFYLVICACMALCPVWFWLIFKSTDTAQRELELYEVLNSLDDEDYWQVKNELAQQGGLPMQPIQRWALVFLGCYFLFEVFFISAWVKDLVLVWQPDWVAWAIEWVKSHVNTPPLNVDRDIFTLLINEKGGWVYENFSNEHEFINSDAGTSVLFYHFIRTVGYLPVLTALSVVLWLPLTWLGIDKINPEHINGVFSFIRACAWSIVMGFFLIIMSAFLIISIRSHSFYIQDITQWLSNFSIIAGSFCFSAMAIRFFGGWITFWKRLIF